ncbi:hypothetical protein MY9_0876 [Bacillus sp. JS]|nr:hypothetical protein MY9_0876 [Bacillus sp. JS]
MFLYLGWTNDSILSLRNIGMFYSNRIPSEKNPILKAGCLFQKSEDIS